MSFKVELRDRSNLREPPQVRRFAVDKDDCTCLAYLHDELLVLFPKLRQHVYEISWIDKDGDDVIIGTNEELVIALKEMHALKDTRGPLYRIRVTVRGQTVQQTRQQMNGVGGYHDGIFCDACNNSVFGFRYKCVVCPDFDLCRECEYRMIHSWHNMMRLVAPPDKMRYPTDIFGPGSGGSSSMNTRYSSQSTLGDDEGKWVPTLPKTSRPSSAPAPLLPFQDNSSVRSGSSLSMRDYLSSQDTTSRTSSMPSEPLRSSIPSEPMRSSMHSEPLRSSMHSEPIRSSIPSEPLRSSMHSEPQRNSLPPSAYSRSSMSQDHSRSSLPSESLRNCLPREPLRSSLSPAPMRSNKQARVRFADDL